MPRSSFFLGCALAALAGCATATDPAGTISDSAGIHDSIGPGDDSSSHGDASPTGDGASDDSTTATDSASATDSSTSIDTGTTADDSGASDAPTDPSCAAASTNNDCEMCCYTAHTGAYDAFAAALTGCACKPGNCDTQCGATACASPPASADATCLSCLKAVQTGACKSDIDAVCGKPSGACYPFARCVITSGCNSKP